VEAPTGELTCAPACAWAWAPQQSEQQWRPRTTTAGLRVVIIPTGPADIRERSSARGYSPCSSNYQIKERERKRRRERVPVCVPSSGDDRPNIHETRRREAQSKRKRNGPRDCSTVCHFITDLDIALTYGAT
jgi:hypothetical protein